MAKLRKRGHGTGSLFKRNEKGCWFASWYDHEGKRVERSTRTTDKAAAERILHKHVADAALRREGVIDARKDRQADHGRRPLAEHIEAYITHCRHAGQSAKGIDGKQRHLQRLLDVGMTRLSDVTSESVQRVQAEMKTAGRSARTLNHLREAVIAFISWCMKTGRLENSPLTALPVQDQSRDRRRIRRPLTDQELDRLLAVAEDRGRKLWYLAAALAGLRKGDLQRLRWSDIDRKTGTITITEGKAKRSDLIPIHPELAHELQGHLAAVTPKPGDRVFPQTVTDSTRRKDFLRAGLAREVPALDDCGNQILIGTGKYRRPKKRIVTEDEQGRIVDLHAMRTTLGTNLARAGVTPQVAQRIMRHADYRTTLKHYTALDLTDTSSAIEKLQRHTGASSPQIGTVLSRDDSVPGRPPQKSRQLRRETTREEVPPCDDGQRTPIPGDSENHLIDAGLCGEMRRHAARCGKYPQRESNPCFQDENLASWATRRWGLRGGPKRIDTFTGASRRRPLPHGPVRPAGAALRV